MCMSEAQYQNSLLGQPISPIQRTVLGDLLIFTCPSLSATSGVGRRANLTNKKINQTPNPKHQITNKLQVLNSKFQYRNSLIIN